MRKIISKFLSWDVSAILGTTFIALLSIILFIWLNNEQRLRDMRVVIDLNQQASKKMQLLNELTELARSRTSLTATIIYEEDSFLQDEIGAKLDALASEFSQLRSLLISLPLTQKEKDLLAQQGEIVSSILPAQRRSVDLAIRGDPVSLAEAAKLLHETVTPGQNKLVFLFSQLIDFQQNNIDRLAVRSQQSYEKAQKQNRVLVGVVLITGSLLSIVVFIRVRNIQRKVINARDQLEIAVDIRTQELAESQTMLQIVLDTIPTRVFWKDASGKYLGCNRLFARDAGELEVSDIKGRTDADLIWERYAEQYTAEDRDVIEKGLSVVDREEPGLQGETGTWREMTKVPLTNNKGEIIGVLGSYNDITERKRMERIKDDFVSTVSHELRTPLTSIHGSISLLMGGGLGDPSPKAIKLLDLADRNTNRLLALINDLLDVQKLQAGEMVYDFETVYLNHLVQNAVEENAHYAVQHGVEFVITENTSVNARVDVYRMMQVMGNLLSNAAKFSFQGSNVEISLTRDGDDALVKIKDYGEGIPEQFHDVMFERFTQVDTSDTKHKGGTGLGLAITQSIIEQHGGSIGFDTEVGVGTTFYFRLPPVE